MEYVRIDFRDEEKKNAYIEHVKNNMQGEWDILHYPVDIRRSNQQNRYYRIILQLISEESGMPIEDLHILFRTKYAKICRANPEGKPSTAKLSKSEFTLFISLIRIWFWERFSKTIDEEIYP